MTDRKNLILASVLIGTLMSAVDTTIVILAIVNINDSLNSTLVGTIWVILIYLLVLAVFTTQLGKLGDIFGRARMFNSGFLIFIAGSAVCGASFNITMLIISRAFQGLGAALLQANSSAIVADYFPPSERGRAFGITSSGWNIGGTLGIVLGGIITTFIGWQYIFYINVPIGIAGFLIAVTYVKDNKVMDAKIDYPGMLLLLAILSLITYSATHIAGNGITQFNMILASTGILLIIPFVIIEARSDHAVINMKAFRNRVLSYSLLAAFLQALGYLSIIFILIMYLQGIKGFDPLTSSLILVPGYVVASFLAPRMGRFSDRIGAGKVATAGISLMAVGVLIYFTLGVGSSFYVVIAGSLVSGIGGSMFWPSNNSSVMSAAPRELYGSISGLLRTISSIGTLMSYVLTISIASLTIPRYVAFSVFLGTGTSLAGSVALKFMDGIHSALLMSIVLLIAAGVLSFARSGRKANSGYQEKDDLSSVVRKA